MSDLLPDSVPEPPVSAAFAGAASGPPLGRDAGPPTVDEELVDDVEALIEDGQRGLVLNLVADLHPADLADLIEHLKVEDGVALLRWLPDELAGAALPELDSARRAVLLDELTARELVPLLDELSTDDAADVLADVDDEMVGEILPHLEDAVDVGALLAYDEDTAGGIMETELAAVSATATVAEATEEVRRLAETVEPIYVVYVVDEARRLTGIVSLQRLLLARADTPLSELADTEFVAVGPDRDQEEVARIMERYDLIALPVVDADGRLLGRITIDDIVDVIREEAEEDLQRASGIRGEEELAASAFAISRGRLPWLVVGMAGAFLSGLVIRTFEADLERAVVLATFIPLITAMGGNAAIQSAAIAVQGLVSGELWVGEGLRRIGKELVVALMNGLALALVLGAVVLALGLGEAPQRLALTVGTTLLLVVVLATTNGALVPFVLKRVGVDPATAMGPFVTTLNDIIGLTVYFLVASVLYL